MTTILALEESLFATWPALETERYDGWVLRSANGYTGRSNTVTALYDSTLDIDEKIDYVEAWYRARGRTPGFRLLPTPQSAVLDAALERRGYQLIRRANGLIADLRDSARVESDAARVTLDETFSEAWADAFCAFNPGVRAHRATLTTLLPGITQPKRFASVWADGERVAVGLIVRDGDRAGLYDIAVREDARGRGIGKLLIGGLLAHAREDGATHAFLQMDAENTPARRLYTGMGFRDVYPYWYR